MRYCRESIPGPVESAPQPAVHPWARPFPSLCLSFLLNKQSGVDALLCALFGGVCIFLGRMRQTESRWPCGKQAPGRMPWVSILPPSGARARGTPQTPLTWAQIARGPCPGETRASACTPFQLPFQILLHKHFSSAHCLF